MQADRFTVKSQEAVAAAQQLAAALSQPRGGARAPAARPARAGGRLRAGGAAQALRRRRRDHRPGPQGGRRAADRRRRRGARAAPGAGFLERPAARRAARWRRATTSTSRSATCCWRWPTRPSGVADILPDRESLARAVDETQGPSRVTSPNAEEMAEALEKFGRDLTADARAEQARPGDRPRRGDPPGDPGALAADEEQPGADRRARASARPRSSRASRSGSSTATSPSRCATGA